MPLRTIAAFLLGPTLLLACSSSEPATVADDARGDVASDAPEASEAPTCCPRDPQISSCMNIGGAPMLGECHQTCDFRCSTNWRVDTDAHGCEYWRYDVDTACLQGDAGGDG
jgi:hypothetical protein